MKLYISDIDGVFTDMVARADEQAIELSAKIGSKNPFAYVTGRSTRWLEQNFLPRLEISYKTYRPKFPLICAEYGGIVLRYSMKKGWVKQRSSSFLPLDKLRSKIRSLIAPIQGVFFDDTKEVMISVEARHDMRTRQHDVVEKGLQDAERILKEFAQKDSSIEFIHTTYACDLTPRILNKSYGVRLILNHLDSTPEYVHLIGDSPSDFLLAEPLLELGLPFTMHYVGDKSKLKPKDKTKYNVQTVSKEYNQGTVEVLRSLVE